MRIEGVDPLILNQVQSQTQKPAVQDAKKINVDSEQEKRRQEGQAGYSQGNLEQAVEKLNAATELFNIKLRFKLDHEKGEIYVLVIDAKEGKIIRRIPPENVLKVASQMQQLVGLLLDELI
ncbi:MAG: flagellar protein FlaG [Moorella sp. (in: firmicutes)]|uniref:flagellar protein FlaG n=1 Tax=unclassified Neomoorella TaxID=2676739 RepID=UPI0010FFABBB|nr:MULTISPECIES: flagellar protein FlaG [unclassified Moorella (in: firmicutes)]MDK2816002.1 flagellar protein FlaG [Moorella sp. (in: firmicutes)]GEA16637.1 flagellar protein FlaG [Moorella sp. E308F]GEA17174.1 flagellar protein FlaG [Moorella sp. E306M]